MVELRERKQMLVVRFASAMNNPVTHPSVHQKTNHLNVLCGNRHADLQVGAGAAGRALRQADVLGSDALDHPIAAARLEAKPVRRPKHQNLTPAAMYKHSPPVRLRFPTQEAWFIRELSHQLYEKFDIGLLFSNFSWN